MYSISIDPRRAMVAAKFQGEVALSERCDAIDEIAAAATIVRATRVLVDFTAASLKGASVEMAIRFARTLAANETLRQCLVAYVLPDAYGFEPAIEMFARGRGFAAERFASRSDAVAWLEG